MNTQSASDVRIDRTIDAWLELGPTELSRTVLERVREEIERGSQAKTRRRGRNLRAWNTKLVLAAITFAAVMVGVTAIGVRLVSHPSVGTSPSAPLSSSPVPGDSPSPSASNAVSASPLTERSPSSSRPAVGSPTPTAREFVRTGSMTAGRIGHTATLLLDGRVLIAGGSRYTADAGLDGSGQPLTATAELYDPATAVFTPTGSMTTPRAHHTATLLADGRVLIAGGGNSGTEADHGGLFHGFALASAEIYDPSTGRFSATQPMHDARIGGTALRLADARVLIVGGVVAGDVKSNYTDAPTSSAEIFDPAAGTFVTTGASPIGWVSSAVLLNDGRALVTSYRSSATSTSVRSIYDPVAGSFTELAELTRLETAIGLSDGRVLFIEDDAERSKTAAGVELGAIPEYIAADVYEPETGSLLPAAAPDFDFTPDAATLLADGRVLIIGYRGRADAGRPPYAIVFDPVTNDFSVTAAPTVSAAGRSATLLLDDSVLIAGGGSNEARTAAFTDAELFR